MGGRKTELHVLKHYFKSRKIDSLLIDYPVRVAEDHGKSPPHYRSLLSLHIDLREKKCQKNFYLYYVALLSNNQSERSMTDHEKKRMGKTQAGRTEPQTAQRNVLTSV